ncbi:patatin-like phospholipase, partial [Metarhizium majus ARSEF 297]
MPCSHTSWLRLSDKNHEISLQVSDRPKRLLAAVASKRSKSSSLVLLIGNHQKAEAIRKLGIAYRSESGQRGHADIHLFIAPKDRFSSPTIVADGDLPIHNRAQSRSPPSRCHEMTHSSLSSSDGGRQKTSQHAEMVYHRLLLPFADVVCLFLDDLGGVNLAARKLAAWLNYGRASSGSVLPWLLLVAEDGRGENNIIAEFERGVRDETSISLLTRFQGVQASHWRRLYSEDTCYSCMMRRPKYKLPCGHWVCDICMKIFGTKKNVYLSLDNCPLCGGHGIRIRFKPDTATVRVLCIDGGGTRACVPLRFLQELEARVGLPYPVQCNFDILFGTSSALARAVFRPRRVASLPLAWIPSIHRIWQTILSVLLDSRYPSRNIEAALKKVFGSSRNIADFSLATEMGLHIGMPVTATNDTSTHLVTNYNGVGKRNQDGGRRTNELLEALLSLSSRRLPDPPNRGQQRGSSLESWDSIHRLRATTAAPYFFAPQDIGGRQYQDGGVGPYNNPAGLAYAETAALFPDTPQPSLVASFGTGSSGGKQMDKTKPPATISRRFNPSKVTKPRKKNRRRSWSDLFVFRIFQAFLSHGDSTRAWKQLLSQRAEQSGGEFFRFDVQYDGSAPSLDNITDLDEMEELAEECIMASPSLDRLALCIRAQNFYFELDGEPQYSNGLYECAGHIFCRLEPGSEEHSAFLESLDSSSSHFQVGSKLLSGTFLQESARGQNNAFSKQIKFCVHGRQVPFEIVLREGFEEASNISGSPFTIDQLVKAQKIDARFGTADHRP